MGGPAVSRSPGLHMVSEFDLPCTACGQDLVEAHVVAPSGDAQVTVAECQNCGTRHYPETALESA